MKICNCIKIPLEECHKATGLVVVIDVIFAFTTTAYAFASGAKEIHLVGSIEDAFSIQKKLPDAFLMGEVNGEPIKDFHFQNSPNQMSAQDLRNKTLIQRTTCGTQGVVRSTSATQLLASSFVVAEATLKRIRALEPDQVTFVITGGGDADEDWALADYLESKMTNAETKVEPYLERVVQSSTGKLIQSINQKTKADLKAVLQVDKYSFAMEVQKNQGLYTLITLPQ